MKVFLDANVLFSASDPSSATRELLLAVCRAGEVVTSPHAWEEASRNLGLKRPEHLKGLADLSRYIEMTHAFGGCPRTTLPDMDIPILAAAIGAGCTHLWTSDKKHFGRYYGQRLAGVLVVSNVRLAGIVIPAK
jgi:hypothetical protein